jgi:hypothetical protein
LVKFFDFVFNLFSFEIFFFKSRFLNVIKPWFFNNFSNLVMLRFEVSLMDCFYNPLALSYFSGFSKISGYQLNLFDNLFVNFFEANFFLVFFSFLIFLRFFFFLFFLILKNNFFKPIFNFDFLYSRFFFFKFFSIVLVFFKFFSREKN